jgi:Mrp family chromosome partitioning ATPase
MRFQSEIHTIDEHELIDDAVRALSIGALQIDIEPGKQSRLVFLTDPCGLAVERYKLLRRRLCALSPHGGLLLITSPNSGDGKTLTSLNLAYCLAEGGHHTCLVDLDFRSPGVCFSMEHEAEMDDVVDVLAGNSTISRAIRQIGDRPLYILGIHEGIESPSRQLDPAVLGPFLKKLRDGFEWVILDIAPVIPMSDVAEVLPHVDGALMVVRSGKTKKSLVGPSLEILGTKLWGVVLNDSLINGSAYYGYYASTGKRKNKK